MCFLYLFNNECIIISFFKEKKPLSYQRGGDFINECSIIFSILFSLAMFHDHEALWSLKNYKLYNLCTLILSNSLHLTIGSKVILTQIEF
jgi:hypothetical protein